MSKKSIKVWTKYVGNYIVPGTYLTNLDTARKYFVNGEASKAMLKGMSVKVETVARLAAVAAYRAA